MREKQQKRFVRRIGVGGYQLSDSGKGKKKGRTVPFMHCSTETNKTSRLWKRPQNVVGC